MAQLGNVLFIVWRESVEAMLVIGILYAWLRTNPNARNGFRYLWAGVAIGLGIAVALGAAILTFEDFFAGEAQDYFQLGMVLVAAALIVQMVLWMRRHGRTLKRELEGGLAENAARSHWWGITVLTALAVGREGSETVIFLFGLGLAQKGFDLVWFSATTLLGFVLALLTFAILQVGSRILSWRTFFRVTEALLLLLAASLLMTGLDKLFSLGWLPTGIDPLWNTRWLLNDGRGFGGLVAALTGYRATPSLTAVLVIAGFWGAVWYLLRRSTQQAKPVIS